MQPAALHLIDENADAEDDPPFELVDEAEDEDDTAPPQDHDSSELL